MKLTIIILIIGLTQVSAKTFGQLVSLHEKNTTIQKVFNTIETQAGYHFIYDDKLDELFKAKRVNIDVENRSVSDVLDACFKGLPVNYTIIQRTIALKETERFQNEKVVPEIQKATGNVKDGNGVPLPGASIKVKGSGKGTVADTNGEFSIDVKPGDILIISYIGYQSREVTVQGTTQLNVVLIALAGNLNEMVITGYSSQRKMDITGSVAVVDMKSLKSIPAGTGEQALQGMASGVNVISSGVPGGQSNVFIRGLSSFGDNQPLIIVDGVQGTLHDIDINDIESMQILKDAGAASIYGVRGSNGVVVITTKKGKAEKFTLSYDAYYGDQEPPKGNVFNLLNSQEYASLVKKINPSTALFPNGLPDYTYAGPNVSGVASAGDPAVDPSKYNLSPNDPSSDYLIQKVNKQGTDWFHEIFKSAPEQSHTLTASGGVEKLSYLLSLGVLDQQGTLINTYLKRYSGRVNTEVKITDHIRIGENLYAFYKNNPGFVNLNSFNAVAFTYRTLPIIPVYDIAGNYGGSFDGPELGNGQNPVAIQQRTKNNKNNIWDIIGNVYGEVDFLKHFTARTSFGGTVDNQYNETIISNAYNDLEGHNGLNGLQENSLYNNSWMWTNTLTYKNTFGKHSVKILGGSEAIRNSGRSLFGSSNGFFSTNPDYFVLGNGTSNIANASAGYINTLYSLFSRLDYSFDDRYLLSATIRRDGSSQFGVNKRYGVFPSFSAGWRVSHESFMKDVTFIDDLKLKGSWGKLGSQNNIRPNNAYTLFSSNPQISFYDINGQSTNPVQGFYQSANGNPNTGWEEDKITNVGFDATIFKNIDLSVEWYKKNINGLLFPQALPYTAGAAAAPIINIGDVENKGWDISAGYRGSAGTDLHYNIGVNVTTYKNKIVRIPGDYFDVVSSELGTLVRNEVGHPIGSFYGYQVVGLFRDAADVSSSPTQDSAAPGRFKYKDINGDGKIDADDRTFFGNPNPDFTYGVNLSLSYKAFDFSAQFYGSHGNKVLNYVRYYTDFYSTLVTNKSKDLLYNSWTPTNLNAKTPIAEFGSNFSTSGVPNSYYMEDGSFLKCRSIILGYNLSPAVLQKINIKKLRVYGQVGNVFMITKYKGLDPELSGSLSGSQASSSYGVDFGNYPNNQRSFILGVNVSL